MDVALALVDKFLLTPYVYTSHWSEDDITRQCISLFFLTTIAGGLLYLFTASLNYYFIFNHKLLAHPSILPNQVYIFSSFIRSPLPVCFDFLFNMRCCRSAWK